MVQECTSRDKMLKQLLLNRLEQLGQPSFSYVNKTHLRELCYIQKFLATIPGTLEGRFSLEEKKGLLFGSDVVASEALGRVYTAHPNNSECFYPKNVASYNERTNFLCNA
ncbi:hypothetical protein AVEN_161024-1 [Araneus ventricosus]|uniref:Uncharacterized protein n=1 Tax=Araneus ventricosus TaxID=182803 RepID=A0A4Y2C572_ARAVE|nr:hypothetical protein AVEN_161024-1 [Araneus ventricosus]